MSWVTRKARLCTLLKTSADEDETGLALDRIIHGHNVIGKTAKSAEIDALRFQDADLQLVGTLERGQFGLIDVVKCTLDGRTYVRKSIEKRFQCAPQFERDILRLARRKQSVWVPHLLCAFQTQTHLNLVMNYAEGGSLWDVLESSPLNGRVSEEDMAWWTPQIISAIHWCHSQGFAHRDIKPHNFVITPDAHVLLIDFGSAAPTEHGRIPKKYCLVPCGTCDYISPEILTAHEQALVALEMEFSASQDEAYGYGIETDWWSLGAMLYEMVYGVAPFFAADIGRTYLRIVEHERSLRFDSAIPVSAVYQDLIRRFLTHPELRLGRRGIEEIQDHPAFVEVNWSAVSTEPAPEGLHLPQFAYAEPSVALPLDEEEAFSQPFAFSALFQSSPTGSTAGPATVTPRRASVSVPQEDLFIGFSWGPAIDAFPEETSYRSSASASPQATPRPTRLSVPRSTKPTPATPAPHSYPFLTPIRPGTGTVHQTLPRPSTARRTVGGRPVSDREAMKQLAECIGMSARKRVLESGRKPRILPSYTNKTIRFLPAISVPDFASSSQARARPAVVTQQVSSDETTETESEVLSRRSGTPTITFSGRSGLLVGSGHSASLGAASQRDRSYSAASQRDRSYSVPSQRDRSHSVPSQREPSYSVATPTFEESTFDELEDKHYAIMEDILMLEEQLEQISLHSHTTLLGMLLRYRMSIEPYMLLLVRDLALKLVRNDLPLGRARLAATILFLIFAIVNGGLCLKVWTKHGDWQRALNAHLPQGASAKLEYNDLKMTSICLFVATHIATFVASHTVILILHDIYGILPEIVLRRLPRGGEPLTTFTLPHQSAALLFSVVCVIIAGSFHMNVVLNRSGTVFATENVDRVLQELRIVLPYWEAHYVLVSAGVVPATILSGLLALFATTVAWRRRVKEEDK
ncbi:hypothetical protein MKEN_00510500 [Mycena kentingensis (nom. inval.)]|nr:hypothetical protein MKEN_00510500 [Mycena kentingensis (nom. inval.)]